MVAVKHLTSKLGRLNGTQDSIETASFFMIQNSKEAQECVELWADQIKLALPSRKLYYLYVANDVLQKSRRSDYPAEFARVLPSVLQSIFSHTGPEVKLKVKKILNIWRERNVYDFSYLNHFETMAGLDGLENVHSTDGASPDEDEIEAVKLASEIGRELKAVPPLLGPVIAELKSFESITNYKNIQYQNTLSVKTELFDIQESMKVTFDRKINENVAIEVQKGLVALDNYDKAVYAEIQAREKIIDGLKEFIQEQEAIIDKRLKKESARIFEKKTILEEVAKGVLPRIFFSEVDESSKVPLMSLAESVAHKFRDSSVNVNEKMMEMLKTPVDDFQL